MVNKSVNWKNFDPEEVPDSLILSHPLVRELAESTGADNFEYPLFIKDKVLMDEGTWNNHFYSPDSIMRAFENTDWEDRERRDLFLDHKDREAGEWVGSVENIRMENNKLIGDLKIDDWLLARKMSSGKPKFGISPKVSGKKDIKTNEMFDFVFDNFSIVKNPAVKTAYINNSEDGRLYKDNYIESEKAIKEVSDKMAEEETEVPVETVTPETETVEPTPETPTEAAEDEAAGEEEVAPAEETPEGDEELAEKTNETKIGLLESLLSELKEKRKDYTSSADAKLHEDMVGLKKTIQKMQATMVKLGSEPDKRSVKAESNSVIDYQAKLKEIEKDPDLAMKKWIESTGGY